MGQNSAKFSLMPCPAKKTQVLNLSWSFNAVSDFFPPSIVLPLELFFNTH